MIAITKREFFALFYNVTGWLFVGALVALYGLYFFLYNLLYGMPSIAQGLSAITFVFMIAVPILTMRILSEERRNRTDQLIMTAPVSTWEIVLGKYLALAAVLAIPVCLIAVSPIILSFFGKADFVSSYIALLGFCLYGLLALALGLFISSLTESVVISAVVSFILLFLGFMMASITQAVFSDGGMIATVLNAFDLIGPLDDLCSGSLNLVSILYYVSLTALFLFLTVESIEKRRWSISVKKISGSVFSGVTIALVLVCVIAVNVLVAKMPTSTTVIDMTKEKYYSITRKTRTFLKDYKEKVSIYVVGTKSEVKSTYEEIPKTLKKYEESCKNIKVTYVNAKKNPTFFGQFDMEGLETGSLVVQSPKRFKAIPASEMYETEVDYSTYSQTTTGYDGEGQITSALEYVATDDIPVFFLLEGHKELPLGNMFTDVLDKSNYETKPLNLLKHDKVPKKAAALLINGVQSDLSEDDAKKISAYFNNGGNVIVSMDFLKMAELTNEKSMLSFLGIETVDGVIAELDKKYYYQNPFYLLPKVEASDVTGDLEGKASVFMPFAVGLTHGEKAGITYTELMTTSKKATAKTGYTSAEEIADAASVEDTVKKEAGDPDGPFVVSMEASNEKGGKLVVIGSTYFLTDASDQMVSFRNSRFFENVCHSMVSEEEGKGSVVIPVKKYDNTRLTVNAQAANVYGLLFIFAAPIACLFAGIFIWLKRRRR